MSAAGRYCMLAFPPYRHLPGRTPHPTRHPDGHSYGFEAAIPRFEATHWRQHERYHYGIDLHNHGYYWECHEALEGVWRTRQRDEEVARFLQGLIQLSVAHSHAHHRHRPELGHKLANWALDKWQGIETPDGLYAGIDLTHLRALTHAWLQAPERTVIHWGLHPDRCSLAER